MVYTVPGDELTAAKQLCGFTNWHRVRPDAIHNIITVEGVKSKNVIAILILLFKHESIDALLVDGLEDDDLTLVKYENYLRSQGRKKSFKSFIICPGRRDLVNMFLETQWEVWVAVLDFKDGNLTPITLPSSSGLPLDYDEIGKTGYSVVYKGTLWPSHYKGIEGEDGSKEDKKYQYYHRELVNLEQIRMIENVHLSKLLAYCEQAADGPQKLKRTTNVFIWALQQITGLTHALELIHQTGTRHGDLKPSNTLHFANGDDTNLGTLKIADFGVSRKHSVETGLRTKPTITSASTFTYKAAEAREPYKSWLSRSRKYDGWSLGCIMLEFVIWLLHDFADITSFKNQRKPRDSEYYRPIIGSDPDTKVIEDAMEVHPMVDEAVRGLEEHPWFKGTAIQSITKLARLDLLKIKPETRLGAGDMHRALQDILATAREDMSLFTEEVNEAHPVPLIFSQPAQNVTSQATYGQH
ncbi:kinase-like domain-containing protein [Nemania sp. FL0031]|nr:kinase-like domain-containing protein [Nemania sp. FL0031]